ncbi:hypothetical protein SCG7109_AN_00230 [Chlamydiales bacterium SCGC AG-110-M15]|nr:hypothetical protein SCG7109_AN_00230 [Chlamydiales bacterium SCGC AG-110-M15]
MFRTKFGFSLIMLILILPLALFILDMTYESGFWEIDTSEHPINLEMSGEVLEGVDYFLIVDHKELHDKNVIVVVARPGQLRVEEMLEGEVVQNDSKLRDLNEVVYEDEDADWLIPDYHDVVAHLHVPAESYDNLELMQKVLIEGRYSGIQERGVIAYLSPELNPDTKEALARAVIDNRDNYWKAGDKIRAYVLLYKHDVDIVLPKSALIEDGGLVYVLVKIQGGFVERLVKVGRTDHSHVEILEGLDEEEIYALDVEQVMSLID